MIATRSTEPARPLDTRYELTEEGLAGLAAAGDMTAYSDLVALLEAELRTGIRRRMARHLHGRVTVDEVLQDVIVALLYALQRFQPRGEGSLRAYTSGVVVNKVRDAARRCSRERENAVRLETSGVRDVQQRNCARPLDLVAFRELEAVVAREIDRLPKGQRAAARLVLLEGWSYSEAGEQLKLTDDATRLRVKRACETLRPRIRNLVA